MDLRSLKSKAGRILYNLPGWHTDRKIVVIESDDWGSIRMPSREIYEQFIASGIRLDLCPYNRYDSLASEEDLLMLFDLLYSFVDQNGNHPIFTANSVIANPDFEKIKATNYEEYHYELIPETLNRYPKHTRSFSIWKEGINSGIFKPQFHGREHLNVKRWMKALKQNLPVTKLAFDNNFFGIDSIISNEMRRNFMPAFDQDYLEDIEEHKRIIVDGLNHFFSLFEYQSKSFIAPSYTWNNLIEKTLFDNGVDFIQSNPFQKHPNFGQKYKYIPHFLGQRNRLGQFYLTRSAHFEPSMIGSDNALHKCLRNIKITFNYRKPVIIGSHRLNYIGYIDAANRDKNIKSLRILLTEIQKRWPEAEFFSSDMLGLLIKNGNTDI